MPDYGLPLGRLYGPAWINPEFREPSFRNIWDAKKAQIEHHCPDCDGVIKDSCYNKLHLAFCICLISMPNKQQRFCGQRFSVESSRVCGKHGWGKNDENRVFQLAKKGLEWSNKDLPSFIPHEQPGWEMKLSSLGHLRSRSQSLICIRMSHVDGELCFVQVLSDNAKDQPDELLKIARVPTRELLLMPLTESSVGQP